MILIKNAVLPAGQRTKVVTLMGFNPATAGGLMSVDVASCPTDVTAAQAISILSEARTLQPEALLNIHARKVTGELVGVVSVIGLLQSDPATPVIELLDLDPVRVTAEADVTDIALLMADYNLVSIPVVDAHDRVLRHVKLRPAAQCLDGDVDLFRGLPQNGAFDQIIEQTTELAGAS